MHPSTLPGSRWLAWVRDPTLRFGVLVGAYLTVILLVSLLLATRVPVLEPFANYRNAACFVAFALAAALPVARRRASPRKLFVVGIAAWLIFSVVYWLSGFAFVRLHSRFYPPTQVFLIGATLYGLAAVIAWVADMVRHARTQPITASRRHPY